MALNVINFFLTKSRKYLISFSNLFSPKKYNIQIDTNFTGVKSTVHAAKVHAITNI